jgi:hypothetical protein
MQPPDDGQAIENARRLTVSWHADSPAAAPADSPAGSPAADSQGSKTLDLAFQEWLAGLLGQEVFQGWRAASAADFLSVMNE